MFFLLNRRNLLLNKFLFLLNKELILLRKIFPSKQNVFPYEAKRQGILAFGQDSFQKALLVRAAL